MTPRYRQLKQEAIETLVQDGYDEYTAKWHVNSPSLRLGEHPVFETLVDAWLNLGNADFDRDTSINGIE